MKRFLIPCVLSCLLLSGCVSEAKINEVVKGTYALYEYNGSTYISCWISFSEYFPVHGFQVDMEPLKKYYDISQQNTNAQPVPYTDPFEKKDHEVHQGIELPVMIKAEDIETVIAQEDPLTMYFNDDWGKTHSIYVYYNPDLVPGQTKHSE